MKGVALTPMQQAEIRRRAENGEIGAAIGRAMGLGGETVRRYLKSPVMPACMDDEEWERWCLLNKAITTMSGRAKTPCDDCVTSFALEMRAVDRCNGTPLGVETEDEEPETPPLSVWPAGLRLGVIASAKARKARMQEAVDKARALADGGMPQWQIAQEMGLSQGTVSKYLAMETAA